MTKIKTQYEKLIERGNKIMAKKPVNQVELDKIDQEIKEHTKWRADTKKDMIQSNLIQIPILMKEATALIGKAIAINALAYGLNPTSYELMRFYQKNIPALERDGIKDLQTPLYLEELNQAILDLEIEIETEARREAKEVKKNGSSEPTGTEVKADSGNRSNEDEQEKIREVSGNTEADQHNDEETTT